MNNFCLTVPEILRLFKKHDDATPTLKHLQPAQPVITPHVLIIIAPEQP